jgi:tetratricopeptide (TPR) repeat protein
MMKNELLFEQGKELFATGHPEESIELFTKAEAEGCNPVTIYLNRGAAYLIVGELDKSIDDFNRVLEIDADNERTYYYRGIAHFRKGAYDLAIDDLTRSISMNHERGGAFFARGLAYAELERTDESLRDLKTAVVFSNKEVEGFANLFGENRTLFDKSMALLEGERGPWSIVLDEAEINKLKKWIEPER